jgi:sulfide dehydrogenase cytochrome subunit
MGIRNVTAVAACIVALAAGSTGTAHAQSAPPAAHGCSGCHGPAGEGVGTIPPIARTMGAAEFEAAMRQFRADQRPATIMNRIARGFTDAELAQLAAYFAGKE